jgi:hypothetical protein
VSRGEGELLTVPKPRAVGLLPVCLTVNPVGEPDALIGHVRFDERGWETERWPQAPSYRAHPRLYLNVRIDVRPHVGN